MILVDNGKVSIVSNKPRKRKAKPKPERLDIGKVCVYEPITVRQLLETPWKLSSAYEVWVGDNLYSEHDARADAIKTANELLSKNVIELPE